MSTVQEFQSITRPESARLRFKLAAARILSETVDYNLKSVVARGIAGPETVSTMKKRRGLGRAAQFIQGRGNVDGKHAARTTTERIAVKAHNTAVTLSDDGYTGYNDYARIRGGSHRGEPKPIIGKYRAEITQDVAPVTTQLTAAEWVQYEIPAPVDHVENIQRAN